MMKKLFPLAAVVCSAVLVLAVRSGQSDDLKGASFRSDVLLAQADAAKQAPEAKETPARTRPRRLPNYYGQVGLNPRQREMIYSLQAAYADRIEELERQLEALKQKRDQEIEAVLTPQQKQRLSQLLEAAAARRASRSQSAASPSASAPDDKQP